MQSYSMLQRTAQADARAQMRDASQKSKHKCTTMAPAYTSSSIRFHAGSPSRSQPKDDTRRLHKLKMNRV